MIKLFSHVYITMYTSCYITHSPPPPFNFFTTDFSLEVSAPVIYDCSPENTKQDANTELSTGPASVLTFREESDLFLTPNFSALQAPTSTSSITQEKNSNMARSISANHETELLPAPNASASQKPGPSLDSNSLATQEAEHSPAPTSIEHSPTSTLFANEAPKRNPAFTSSTSEGFNLSPNTSAIQEAEFGSAVSSFITQKSKIASFASSISVLTGGPTSLLLNPVSAYASSAEIRRNIFDTSSQIVSGRPPLWPVTHKIVKRTLFNTQTTTLQTSSSKTRMSLIASSLATSTLKGRTKELLSTSITKTTDLGSGLFYSQEGPGTTTTTTIQEAGYTHLILPTTETKSTINTSVTAAKKTLSRSATQISDAATKTIVHHTALEKAISSFFFQSTGIPEQTGTKDVANLPDDREDGHLKAELLKILGKRSSPDSRETVSILKEIQPREKSVLKSLHEMFYHGRPLATTIKLESLCGFEAGMCGWKQIIDDDLDWSLASGSVNVDTGHLKAGGKLYLYCHV